MHKSIINLIEIEKKIHLKNTIQNLKTKIIAVSKTFPLENIFPLINHGHIDFGENKVQEAIEKWTEIKKKNSNIKLHMIGKLQTNKVKFVIPLFDYIHSLDNIKLAKKISSEEKKLNNTIEIGSSKSNIIGGINDDSISPKIFTFISNSDIDDVGFSLEKQSGQIRPITRIQEPNMSVSSTSNHHGNLDENLIYGPFG